MLRKRKNVYETIHLTYYLLKLFGFCQITINFKDFKDLKSIRTTYLDGFLTFFWSFLFGKNFISCFLTPYDMENYSSAIYLLGSTFSNTFSNFLQAWLPISNFYHRWKIVKIFQTILTVDEKVILIK